MNNILSRFFRLIRNPRKVALIILLLPVVLCIGYIAFHVTRPISRPVFHNDLERMNYAMKSTAPDEYKETCKSGISQPDVKTNIYEYDTTCWFDFYKPLLTEIGFKSFDLFYDYRVRMLKLSKMIDDKTTPETKMKELYLEEQDRFADLLETRVRNNMELGVKEQ